MKTRQIMLIDGEKPLAGVQVRVSSAGELGDQWTDPQGLLLLDEGTTEISLEINLGGERFAKTISLHDDTPLKVINVAKTPTSLELVGSWGALVGQVLGQRYRIDGVLGQGGMGVVLRAQDLSLERVVAIKMLSAEAQANPDAQRIFMAEAKSIAALAHPNLVTIHDVTQLDGRPMIVFEHVQGLSLEELVDRVGALPEALVIGLGAQLTSALVYMHSNRLIHRDIKPANALLREDGRVKVIDFGLTRSLEELNQRGTSVRGTPAYMAPEQILNSTLSEATDIYQIGATLYELATGRLPFEDEQTILSARIYQTPEPPRSLTPSLSPALDRAIMSCLAVEPADRPSAAALLDALSKVSSMGVLNEPGISAAMQPLGLGLDRFDAQTRPTPAISAPQPPSTPSSSASSAPSSDSTRRALILAASVILLLVGVSSVVAWRLFIHEPQPQPQSSREPAQLTVAPTPPKAQAPTVEPAPTPAILDAVNEQAPPAPEPLPAPTPEPEVAPAPKRVDPAPAQARVKAPAPTVEEAKPVEPVEPKPAASVKPDVAPPVEEPPKPAESVKAAAAEVDKPDETEDNTAATTTSPTTTPATPAQPATKKVIRRKVIRKVTAPPRGF